AAWPGRRSRRDARYAIATELPGEPVAPLMGTGLNDQANSYALSAASSSRLRFSLMKMPFIVIQIAWQANGISASSPGTASTGPVSPPTHATLRSARPLPTVAPGPGQPLLHSALSFFHSFACAGR